jgi:hypothetical protein
MNSVANSWQIISAKSSEKFGRQRKGSAAHIILSQRLFSKHYCSKLVAKKLSKSVDWQVYFYK